MRWRIISFDTKGDVFMKGISPNKVSVTSKILSFQVFKVAMSVVSPEKEYHQDGEASSVVLVPRFLKIGQVGNILCR